jgi:hypothetical protein
VRRLFPLALAAALVSLPAAALAAAPDNVPGAMAQAGPPASDAVVAVAAWAIRTGDHGGQPFAVVDKRAARVFVFGADGKLKGEAPALIGSAVGDVSRPMSATASFPPSRRMSAAPRPGAS